MHKIVVINKKTAIFLVILIVAFIVTGCVERKLTIKSEPPGADVYFNDAYVGKTPVNFDFMWYWDHRVRLEKEGYQKVERLERIKAKPHFWIPADLIMELLPFKIKDYHELSYALEKIVEVEKENEE